MLYVSPDASLRFWARNLSTFDREDLCGTAHRLVRPGMRVWDIGANVGIFAFAAAGLAGPDGEVVAVEADAWLARLLRRSEAARQPTHAPVTVVCAAVADRARVVTFNIAARGRATNAFLGFGFDKLTGGVRETQAMAALPLDALLERFQPPDVLKIDVEGAAALVLAGAPRVLEARPAIIIEVPSESAEAVTAILAPLRYRFFDLTGSGEPRPSPVVTYDTLALPRQRGG